MHPMLLTFKGQFTAHLFYFICLIDGLFDLKFASTGGVSHRLHPGESAGNLSCGMTPWRAVPLCFSPNNVFYEPFTSFVSVGREPARDETVGIYFSEYGLCPRLWTNEDGQ